MREARLPLAYRDGCANLLIPLNRCRFEEYYLPWKCEVSLFNIFFLRSSMGRGGRKGGCARRLGGRRDRGGGARCGMWEMG